MHPFHTHQLAAERRIQLLRAAEHARLARSAIAIEVADDYQRQGVGGRLLRLLGRRARKQGISEFGATLLAEK